MGQAHVTRATACDGIYRLFPFRLPYLGVSHSLFICHWIRFFFTTDVSAPIRSTLHLLMVSFQAWDWLLYPMLWSKRRSIGCECSRNLVSKCLPWPEFEHWTSHSNGREIYH